jgi:hypothetical protein
MLPHFLNASLKSCSVRMFSTAYKSASITSAQSECSYLQSGKQKTRKGPNEASKVCGDDSHLAFCQKFPGEKVSVRRCVVVVQQPVPLLPKFGAKSSHILTQ